MATDEESSSREGCGGDREISAGYIATGNIIDGCGINMETSKGPGLGGDNGSERAGGVR